MIAGCGTADLSCCRGSICNAEFAGVFGQPGTQLGGQPGAALQPVVHALLTFQPLAVIVEHGRSISGENPQKT